MRVAEVHAHASGGAQFGVPGHLSAPVISQGLAQWRHQGLQLRGKAGQSRCSGGVWHLDQQYGAAHALDQYAYGRLVARSLMRSPSQCPA